MIFHCIQGRLPKISDLLIYGRLPGYSEIYYQEMVQSEKRLVRESTEELKAWLERFTKQAKYEDLDTSADYR